MNPEVVVCCDALKGPTPTMDNGVRKTNAKQEAKLDLLREPRSGAIHLRSRALLMLLVILLGSAVARAEPYSCVSPGGRSVLQGEPCRRGQHAPRTAVSKNHTPSASTASNLPAIARRKCIEAGYSAEGAEVFNACQQDILQTAYKHLCEQAGRAGERLDACLQNLHMHDERYAGLVRLDYYCIARDKKYDSPQYRVCAGASK